MQGRGVRKKFSSVMELMAFFKESGRKGGKIAAARMTPEQRRERARKAAAASAKVRSAKAKGRRAALLRGKKGE